MAVLQTRIFVLPTEAGDWAETLPGRVLRPLVREFAASLEWFWFSRYACPLDGDTGDCDFPAIPARYKAPFPGCPAAGHRSLRFRCELADADQAAFVARLAALLPPYDYASSGVIHYGDVGDVGGHRFLGVENRGPGRDVQRARLVTAFLQAVSALVVDALVGPDAAGRFRIETNDIHDQNPDGSSFESMHHMFANITAVPLSVLFDAGAPGGLLGTYWGQPRGTRQRPWNGQQVVEAFLIY